MFKCYYGNEVRKIIYLFISYIYILQCGVCWRMFCQVEYFQKLNLCLIPLKPKQINSNISDLIKPKPTITNSMITFSLETKLNINIPVCFHYYTILNKHLPCTSNEFNTPHNLIALISLFHLR